MFSDIFQNRGLDIMTIVAGDAGGAAGARCKRMNTGQVFFLDVGVAFSTHKWNLGGRGLADEIRRAHRFRFVFWISTVTAGAGDSLDFVRTLSPELYRMI